MLRYYCLSSFSEFGYDMGLGGCGWLDIEKYCIVLYGEYLNQIIWHCYTVYSLIIIPTHLKRHFLSGFLMGYDMGMGGCCPVGYYVLCDSLNWMLSSMRSRHRTMMAATCSMTAKKGAAVVGFEVGVGVVGGSARFWFRRS